MEQTLENSLEKDFENTTEKASVEKSNKKTKEKKSKIKKEKTERIRVNNQSLGEEISNAISHGIGAGLAIAGTVVMIVKTASTGRPIDVVSASLYGSTLILLYLFSCIYHSLAHNAGKRVFRVLDHCSIFLLILGTYIPVCLSLFHNALGWVIFGIMTALSVLGIVFNSINLEKFSKPSLVLYLIMGWTVIFTFKPILKGVEFTGVLFLIIGGLLYSLGVIFFKSKRKYMHFSWHLFVLAGSIFHFFFVYLYIY